MRSLAETSLHKAIIWSLHNFASVLKDCFVKGVDLLRPRNDLQKNFTLALVIATLAIFSCFIEYAIAFKTHNTVSLFYNHIFSLSDLSLCEILGYGLEGYIAFEFMRVAQARGQKHLYALAGIFLLILIDDSLQLHEHIGKYLQAYTGINSHFGEVGGFIALGTFVGMLWSTGLYHAPKNSKQLVEYGVFTVYLGILVFFGVFMDIVHYLADMFTSIPTTVMALTEDGMELITVCLCAISAMGFSMDERNAARQAAALRRLP